MRKTPPESGNLQKENRELRAEIRRLRKAEESLRESEERYRRITSTITDYIYTVFLENGVPVRTVHSAASEAVTGYTPRELESDPFLWFTMIYPEDQEAVRSHAAELLAGRDPGPLEHRIIRKDGALRWVSNTPVIHRGSSGEVVSHDGVLSDITERRESQEAVRKSEERFKSLIQNSSDIIVILDAQGRFVYETPSFSRISGYEPGFLTGRTPVDVIHPDDIDTVLHELGEVYQNVNEGLPTPMRLRRSDGTWVYLEAIGKNLMDFPGIEGVVITARDITDRRKAEEERIEMERRVLHAQKLESLGILAGGIAHDFNNLLMAILGNIDLAMTDLSAASRPRHFMGQARLAARRAADLTNQMLAYSGKGSFDLKTFDLSELVEEMSRLLKASISKTVEFTLNLDRSIPPVSADPAQVQQVVMNLIVNASEAMGDLPGVVTLSTGVRECGQEYLEASRIKEKPLPGRYVFFEVSDTGCGMDGPTLEKLFDPFFSTKFTGRGLGMAAVQGIVAGHKGAVMVESAPGGGTTITVLFPAAAPGRDLTQFGEGEEGPDNEEARMPASSGAILLVDDESMVLDLCSAMVERLGYRVLTCPDGRAAVEAFREHAHDIACVILDLTMPRMDGLTAFEVLKRLKPDVRVIISSGFSEGEVAHRFEGNQPAGFIKKPFTLKVLRRELSRVLR